MFRTAVLCTMSVVASAFLATQAMADDTSQYTLFNPTPTDKMRDFNTDRPTKVNVPYTVDAGHFQIESDLFFHSYDNTSATDTTTSSWLLGNPTFKLGVLDNVDLEANFPVYNTISTTTPSTGSTTTVRGVGDLLTRAKINLFGNEGGGSAFALMPYVKWPTAPQGIGNGFVEGGMAAPLALPLPAGFTTILMGQLDVQKNPNDNGYHVNFPAIINVNRSVAEGVTAFAELYADWSTHPDVRDIYTLDFAVAWSPRPNWQLDLGVYIGLVSAAAPLQLYAGIAHRF
jgi:Putative MetA-pathway of phenol degradation